MVPTRRRGDEEEPQHGLAEDLPEDGRIADPSMRHFPPPCEEAVGPRTVEAVHVFAAVVWIGDRVVVVAAAAVVAAAVPAVVQDTVSLPSLPLLLTVCFVRQWVVMKLRLPWERQCAKYISLFARFYSS